MCPSRPVSLALMAGILAAAAGCDKSKSASSADAVTPAGTPALDLSAKPELLMQVFGDKTDPRMIPIAAIVNGTLKPIGLTRAGWRALDSIYFAPGTKYPVYRDDQVAGEVTVKRGMWAPGEDALYTLPGCTALKPLAAVSVALTTPTDDPTVELIASTSTLARHPPFTGKLATDSAVARLGHQSALQIAEKAGLDKRDLDSLDFHARLIITGATKVPTLLVSFIDPQAGDLGPGAGHTTHLFALLDDSGTGYAPTWRHVVSSDARTAEYQRLVDHVDVNGDGTDELIVESWRYGGDNDLVVLAFKAGAWHEVLRVKQTWCLDGLTKKG